MTLRCKPGDLAVVSTCSAPIDRQLIGKVIRVVSVFPHKISGEPCWKYEGELIPFFVGPQQVGHVHGFLDSCLQPLRPDPGIDETLIRAGLPRRTWSEMCRWSGQGNV